MYIYLPVSTLYPNRSIGGIRHKVVWLLPLSLHSKSFQSPLLAIVTHFLLASVELTQVGAYERVLSGLDTKESSPMSLLTPIQALDTLLKEECTTVPFNQSCYFNGSQLAK